MRKNNRSKGLLMLIVALMFSNAVKSQVGTEHYPNNIKYFFADIKRSCRYPQQKFVDNYQSSIQSFINNFGINGVRIEIHTTHANAGTSEYTTFSEYPQITKDIINYCRQQGLKLFASPAEYGSILPQELASNTQTYANWILDFANNVQPEFLAMFNECGVFNNTQKTDVVNKVLAGLNYTPEKLIGADDQKTAKTIDNLSTYLGLFDVIGSHDLGETNPDWNGLVSASNKPVWATEQYQDREVKYPDNWERVIGSGCEGLVIFWIFENYVDKNNPDVLTARGQEFVDVFYNWKPPSSVLDPNITYFIDCPSSNTRLAADGETDTPYSTSSSTTGADVEWKFIINDDKWHIQRAAGGSLPRLRAENATPANMSSVSSSGGWTQFELNDAGNGKYYITAPSGPAGFTRLQVDNQGNVNFVDSTTNTGPDVQFILTDVSSGTTTEIKEPIGPAEQTNIKLFPNPCNSSIINISLSDFDLKNTPAISIFDITGKEVYADKIKALEFNIDLKLKAGLYNIVITNRNKVYTKNLIVI